jgi:hypothetical protein
MMTTPYTYLIGWSNHNKWYYGVRYAKGCDPSELWKTYFTSSKHVKEFVLVNGEPDVVEVRKTFDDSNKARKWESTALKRLDAVNLDVWLNKTDNTSIDPVLAGSSWKTLTSEFRSERSRKAGLAANAILTPEQKQDRLEKSVVATKEWWATKSAEERSAHSRVGGLAAASKMTAEQKEHRNNRVREVHAIVHTCPYCNTSGKGTAMKRWHFENCKRRTIT